MAFNFTPESPVLNFGPRHHARWSSREFVLWPAWAYRVVAPLIRKRELNILQCAILGLCRAGVFTATGISEHLDIHSDLAALILVELTDLTYLSSEMCITAAGLRVLEAESIETQEMVAGYVFQDPWTGDLWPRFVENLDYCELEQTDQGFPVLMLGTTGKPRRQGVFTVLPKVANVPATPSTKSIVEAVSRHLRGLRSSDGKEDDGDEDYIGDFTASVVQINRVSFVEPEPQPVFLTTYLYVPESEAEATDWYACDPFGLGKNVRLRRRIETVMQEQPGLYNVVNRLVGRSLHDGYEEQRRWLDLIRQRAELEVDQRLTINIRSHKAYDQLLAMESARQEILALGGTCPVRKINEVLRAGVKVLEASFSAMADDYPLGDIWKRTYTKRVDRRSGKQYLAQQNDRKILAAIIEGAIRSVGFLSPPSESLVHVKPGQIRAVVDYGDHWRLRPLITATILYADRNVSHPLRGIAAAYPELLIEIDDVASLGGKAGHAAETTVTVIDAEQQMESVYSLVAILSGLDMVEAKKIMGNSGEIDV